MFRYMKIIYASCLMTEKKIEKTFNNITIINLLNHYTIISKNNNPTIHFVIKHPHLRDAITSFTSPIKEKDQA